MSPTARGFQVKVRNKQTNKQTQSDSDFKSCITLFPSHIHAKMSSCADGRAEKLTHRSTNFTCSLKNFFLHQNDSNSVPHILANQTGLFRLVKHKVLIYKGSSIFLSQGLTEGPYFKSNTNACMFCKRFPR